MLWRLPLRRTLDLLKLKPVQINNFKYYSAEKSIDFFYNNYVTGVVIIIYKYRLNSNPCAIH